MIYESFSDIKEDLGLALTVLMGIFVPIIKGYIVRTRIRMEKLEDKIDAERNRQDGKRQDLYAKLEVITACLAEIKADVKLLKHHTEIYNGKR